MGNDSATLKHGKTRRRRRNKTRARDRPKNSETKRKNQRRSIRRQSIRKRIDFSMGDVEQRLVKKEKQIKGMRKRCLGIAGGVRRMAPVAAVADLEMSKDASSSKEKAEVLLGDRVSEERKELRVKQSNLKRKGERLGKMIRELKIMKSEIKQ